MHALLLLIVISYYTSWLFSKFAKLVYIYSMHVQGSDIDMCAVSLYVAADLE